MVILSVAERNRRGGFEGGRDWEPTTPRDFIRKFEAAYSLGGCPTEENQERLVKQAVAILGGANSSQDAA